MRSGLPDDRLDSWKEIATYLGRGVRTAQRWEREEGLPVHRLSDSEQSTQYNALLVDNLHPFRYAARAALWARAHRDRLAGFSGRERDLYSNAWWNEIRMRRLPDRRLQVFSVSALSILALVLAPHRLGGASPDDSYPSS